MTEPTTTQALPEPDFAEVVTGWRDRTKRSFDRGVASLAKAATTDGFDVAHFVTYAASELIAKETELELYEIGVARGAQALALRIGHYLAAEAPSTSTLCNGAEEAKRNGARRALRNLYRHLDAGEVIYHFA